ncbi:MAG: hypothetical protein K2G09_07220 [Paramuribaculum sp.]|nr:hypothetical protein [Paramuribaculum sp.]
MKKLLTLIVLFLSVNVMAQEKVHFNLTPLASFITDSGEDFVVVPFEGKSTHEIYQTLSTNVGSIYNDPSKVMSGVEDASIKVRGYSSNLCQKKVILTFDGGGHYQLEFKIKDGRVRVTAPYIENQITFNTQPISYGEFRYIVSKWYDKKTGEPKDKNKNDISRVENQINGLVNSILGLDASTAEEEW